MQESANLLESIIRKILLSEQDNKQEKIKKLKANWENATHEEQEDRLYIQYTSLENPNWKWDKEKQDWVPKDQDDSQDDSSTDDSDEKQTPDESWLGRPVPPPDQYTGKNGNLERIDYTTTKLPGEKGPIRFTLRSDAYDSFIRFWDDSNKGTPLNDGTIKPGLSGRYSFTQNIDTIYSFRTYKTQYELIDWKYWEETGKFKTRHKNGKLVAAAQPGTSNHGLGLSIDIYPKAVQDWFRKYGGQYGWSWAEGKRAKEPWHFTYIPAEDKRKTKPAKLLAKKK